MSDWDSERCVEGGEPSNPVNATTREHSNETVTPETLHQLADSWSLAGDKKLLQLLDNIHKNVMDKCDQTKLRLEAMSSTLDENSIFLRNVRCRFSALGNTQFIESRVYDDDLPTPAEQNSTVKNVENSANNQIIAEKVMSALSQFYNKLDKAHVSASVGADGDKSVSIKKMDLYEDRPLPHIIGSELWRKHWHAGLLGEDVESEILNIKEGEADRVSEREDESSIDEQEALHKELLPTLQDSISTNTATSEDSETQPAQVEKPAQVETALAAPGPLVKPTASDLAAELARRLNGASAARQYNTFKETRVTTQPVSSRERPNPQSRPPDRVTGNIFSDEPPPIDQTMDDEFSDNYDDDIFADLHSEKTSKNIFNSSNEYGGLFDDIPNLNKDQSTYIFDDLSESNKNKILDSKKNIEKGLFDDAYSKSDSVSTKVKNVNENKDVKSLFDDEDDIFGDVGISAQKVKLMDSTKNSKILFASDEEDNLFSDSFKSSSTKTYIEQPTKKVEDVKKPVGGISIFGSQQGAISIGSAILKHRKSLSSDEENNLDDSNKVDSKSSNLDSTDDDFDHTAFNPNAKFDDLFEKSNERNKINENSKMEIPYQKNPHDVKSKINSCGKIKPNQMLSHGIDNKIRLVQKLEPDNEFLDDDIDDLFSTESLIRQENLKQNAEKINGGGKSSEAVAINKLTEPSKIEGNINNKVSPHEIDNSSNNLLIVEPVKCKSELNFKTKTKTKQEAGICDFESQNEEKGRDSNKLLENTVKNSNLLNNSDGIDDLFQHSTLKTDHKDYTANMHSETCKTHKRKDASPSLEITTEKFSININDTSDLKKNLENKTIGSNPVEDFFSNIFDDQPPIFKKSTESKKSKNINALFDDDSDDEGLFLKQNDNMSNNSDGSKSFEDFIQPTEDSLLQIFQPQGMQTDLLTVDSQDLLFEVSKSDDNDESAINKSEVRKSVKSTLPDLFEDLEYVRTIRNEDGLQSKVFMSPSNEKSIQQNLTDSNKLESAKNSYVDSCLKKAENINSETHLENLMPIVNMKHVGKLKQISFNINVQGLLPGAVPKKLKSELVNPCDNLNENSDENVVTQSTTDDLKTESENEIEHCNSSGPKLLKSVSFEQSPESPTLANTFSKERAKIQVKRRPSTRKGRKEYIRNSTAFENSSSNSLYESPKPERICDNVPRDCINNENITVYNDNVQENDDYSNRTQSIESQQKSSKVNNLEKLEAEEVTNSIKSADSNTDYTVNATIKKKSIDSNQSSTTIFGEDSDEETFKISSNLKGELKKSHSQNKPPTTTELIFGDEDNKLFVQEEKLALSKENKKVTEKSTESNSKSLFDDSDDDEMLFGGPRTHKLRETKIENIHEKKFSESEKISSNKNVTKSLVCADKSMVINEDSDDDLFGVKQSKIATGDEKKSKSNQAKEITSAEQVFHDPLSFFQC